MDSLDTQSDLSENTKRYDGIVLLMVITYKNDYPVILFCCFCFLKISL
jgi:hypothetical protein